ncbi:MAG: hypothetical protein QM817_29285 [Archangium sp.]
MSDEKELRAALEKAQHDNKLLTGQLAELRAFDPKELLDRIHTLEKESAELRARLETADLVRADWDARVRGLRRELDIARAEQDRLRNLLENERLSR